MIFGIGGVRKVRNSELSANFAVPARNDLVRAETADCAEYLFSAPPRLRVNNMTPYCEEMGEPAALRSNNWRSWRSARRPFRHACGVPPPHLCKIGRIRKPQCLWLPHCKKEGGLEECAAISLHRAAHGPLPVPWRY